MEHVSKFSCNFCLQYKSGQICASQDDSEKVLTIKEKHLEISISKSLLSFRIFRVTATSVFHK